MKTSFFSKISYEILIFIFLILKILFRLNSIQITLPICLILVLFAILSWIIGKIIRSTDNGFKKIVFIVAAFFLGSMVPNSAIFLNNIDGRSLIYKNVFFIICLLIIFTSVNKHESKWDTPILCFICVAIDPIFMFNYMPVIAILLLYQLYASKHAKEDYWFCAAGLLSAAISFLIFFNGRLTLIANFSVMKLVESNWKNITFSLATIFPIVLMFAIFWLIMIKSGIPAAYKRIIVLIMLEPLLSVFALLFKENHLNVIMISYFGQFFLAAYLISTKDKAFLNTLRKMSGFIENNLLLVGLSLIHLSAFSNTGCGSFLTRWLGG